SMEVAPLSLLTRRPPHKAHQGETDRKPNRPLYPRRPAVPQKKSVLVKPLSKQRIEQVLDNITLGDFLTRDHDGDPTLIIPSDKGAGDLEGWLLVNADFFHLVCTLGPKIPRCQWPTATA